MISKEEYEEYRKMVYATPSTRPWAELVCWRCKKHLSVTESNFYVENNSSKTPYKFWYHVSCFKEVAGDLYMVK